MGAGSVLAFVVVWQLIAFRRIVPELFLPGPVDIANAFAAYVARGQIWPDMWISGQELMYGFLLSIAVGLPLGLLMGWYRRLNQALDPFVTFFYSIPRVALTPLLMIWFGIGINSKIAVVFLGAIFAIVINTAAGVRNLVVALDGDIGASLGGILLEDMHVTSALVCIDGLQLVELDYVDIGALLQPAHVVPVVVKSLAFGSPTPAAAHLKEGVHT